MPNPKFMTWQNGDRSLLKVNLQRNGVISVDPEPGCPNR